MPVPAATDLALGSVAELLPKVSISLFQCIRPVLNYLQFITAVVSVSNMSCLR